MFLKNISFYIQYVIAFLIIPFVVIFKQLQEIEWLYEFKDGYNELFKYRNRFEAYKKKTKDEL
jgi:DNA integrity scanning protein DisA with diadenylate cyclase activity